MADGEEARRRSRRNSLPRHAAYRAASGFTSLFPLFSLTSATPRNYAEEEDGSEAPGTAFHKLILGLTLLFVALALAASSALVVYTAWTHDLENGALAFAIMSSQIAMNWLAWKDEE